MNKPNKIESCMYMYLLASFEIKCRCIHLFQNQQQQLNFLSPHKIHLFVV